MNEHLMRAVVDQAIFLASSDGRAINPDVAVAQLETLATSLRRLEDTDRRVLIAFVEQLRLAEAAQGDDTDRLDALGQLAENLGLLE